MSHDPPHDDDPDRAAILARRKRFVALALTGLTTGAAACAPQACLRVADPEPRPPDEQPNQPVPADEQPPSPEAPQPAPQPCLKVAAPQPDPQPAPQPEPQACLKVAAPRDA